MRLHRLLWLAAWGFASLLFGLAPAAAQGGPDAPRLVWPRDGAVLNGSVATWTFRWLPPENQADRRKYVLWVGQAGEPHSFISQEITAIHAGTGVVQVTAQRLVAPRLTVAGGSTFHWKVRPVGLLGAWSEEGTFRTGEQEEAPREVVRRPARPAAAARRPPPDDRPEALQSPPPPEAALPPPVQPFTPAPPVATPSSPEPDLLPRDWPQAIRPVPERPSPFDDPQPAPGVAPLSEPSVSAPLLEGPPDRALVADLNLWPDLRWREVELAGVNDYQVLIQSPGGGAKLRRATGGRASYSLRGLARAGSPLPAGTWRWRVRAVVRTGAGTTFGPWSEARTFRVAALATGTAAPPVAAPASVSLPPPPGGSAPGSPSSDEPAVKQLWLAAGIGLILLFLLAVLVLIALTPPRGVPVAVDFDWPSGDPTLIDLRSPPVPAAQAVHSNPRPTLLGDPDPPDDPDEDTGDIPTAAVTPENSLLDFAPFGTGPSPFDRDEEVTPETVIVPTVEGVPLRLAEPGEIAAVHPPPREETSTAAMPSPASDGLIPDLPEADSDSGSLPPGQPRFICHGETGEVLLPLARGTLGGADLRGASLAGADLLREDLSGADSPSLYESISAINQWAMERGQGGEVLQWESRTPSGSANSGTSNGRPHGIAGRSSGDGMRRRGTS